MKRLLVTGAVPDERNGLRYGGATVLTKVWLDFLNTHAVDYSFAQTNKCSNLKTKTKDVRRSTVAFFVDFLRKIWSADVVMFNFSDHGLVSLYPYLSAFARVLRKKVVVRKFGGSLNLYLSRVNEKKRLRVIKAIEKASLVLFETKAGIEHLKSIANVGDKVVWFPNVRTQPLKRKDSGKYERRLTFLSHICDEKGVSDILTLAGMLGPSFTINLYGSIKEDKYMDFDWNSYGVTYHGQIGSEDVINVLLSTDFLLLPSYREGYPGIVIEAMSVGVPVITTNVGGIPEMITDGSEGIMTEAGDVTTMCQRIQSVSFDEYVAMSEHAYTTFCEKFDAEIINSQILQRISNL